MCGSDTVLASSAVSVVPVDQFCVEWLVFRWIHVVYAISYLCLCFLFNLFLVCIQRGFKSSCKDNSSCTWYGDWFLWQAKNAWRAYCNLALTALWRLNLNWRSWTFWTWPCFMIGNTWGVRFLGEISDPSKGIYGAGAHSDYGLITLLATDDVLGLQVRRVL